MATITFICEQTGSVKVGIERQLTSLEIERVCRLRGVLSAVVESERFDLALVSPTARTRAVATILLRRQLVPARSVELPELYFGNNGDFGQEVQSLCDKLGPAPLCSYLTADETHFLASFADKAALAIRREIKRALANQVLVVSRAVIINAVGYCLTDRRDLAEPLLSQIIGEGEAFRLEEDGRIVFIRP